jgi:alpha-beta hydrolase superfamily lysophospholipase
MAKGDNGKVDYRRWAPQAPRAVLILVHGLGAHAGRWEAAAGFFLEKGIASYAVELRDVDAAAGSAGAADSIEGYCGRVLELMEIAAREYPWKNIFLVGESLGAIVSLLAASGRTGLLKGIICISPAFKAKKTLTPSYLMRMFWLRLFAPEGQIALPFDSAMCTRDAAYIDKLNSDPREYRTVSVKFAFDILSAQGRARSIKDLALPVLFLLAGEDRVVESLASKEFFNNLTTKDKTLFEFPGMHHALSIDSGKEEVFDGILKWVDRRIAP